MIDQNEHALILGFSEIPIAVGSGFWETKLTGFFYLMLLIWGIFSMNLNVIKIFNVNLLFFYPT